MSLLPEIAEAIVDQLGLWIFFGGLAFTVFMVFYIAYSVYELWRGK